MQAFKAYFKILKRGYLKSFIMYFIIFSLFAVVFNKFVSPEQNTTFSSYQCKVVVVDNDNTDFSKAFTNFIGTKTEIKEMSDEQQIKDALFFREIEAEIKIPKGFSEEFLNGENPELSINSVPDSTNAHLVKLLFNSYLNTYKLYYQGNSKLTPEEISKYVADDLNVESDISMQNVKTEGNFAQVKFFYNFSAYAFLSVIILCIASLMAKLNDIKINRRNNCSPKPSHSFSIEEITSNFVVTIAIWILFNIYAFVLFFKEMTTLNGLLYILNTFVFSMVCLSIALLIGKICKEKIINLVCVVIALGFSFLSGAFVSQDLLGDGVLMFAHALPSYWFIRNNEIINQTLEFTSKVTNELFFNLLVQLCFAAAFISIVLVITKQKKTAEP